ncbi:hypothetical protein OS493_037028 [Desmophyllum pertusum]|uniref:Uncharacterized protein n=1 Tax=Desmophyllum pertusum TaxID=174260 RepID=A0A9W9Y794_9CNID|nr:hypothetical protein OS493_037028 [Desmophyllum pertusum]
MKPNDEAHVFLSKGVVTPVKMEHLQSFFVRFQRDASMKRSLNVHVVDRGDLTVEFCSSREHEIENILCRIEMELPPPTRDPEKTPVEFFGVPLDDSKLHDVSIPEILAACRGVLVEINRGDIYEDHLTCCREVLIEKLERASLRLWQDYHRWINRSALTRLLGR